MAKINLTKEELAHQLKVGGIINPDSFGSAYGKADDVIITAQVDMTCSQLEAAFGFWGLRVLGIDNESNQFIWSEGGKYGWSTFILFIADGALRAKYGNSVVTLVMVDGMLQLVPSNKWSTE